MKQLMLNIETNSLSIIARVVMFLYRFLGLITIPLITVLFIISTTNLLSNGSLTNQDFNVTWALIYAVCFEMNGLRFTIDAARSRNNKKAYGVDLSIGVALIILGAGNATIEGLVNAGVISWQNTSTGWCLWAVLIIRALAIIAMIVRECFNFAELLPENKTSEQNSVANQTSNVTNITVNQTNQTLSVTPNQTQKQTPNIVPVANQTLPNQTSVTELPANEPVESSVVEVIENKPNTEPLKAIPEKSSANKRQIIIDLLDQTPNIKQAQIVQQTGFSKGYVSSVCKSLREV